MNPDKIDNMDIEMEVSSQIGFNKFNLIKQGDISSNITNICTKTQRVTMAKLFDSSLFQNNYDHFLFQKNFYPKQR